MQLLSPPLVRPRCRSPETGDVVLLEDEVRAFAERRHFGAIGIYGGPGSGKTTALNCLRTALGDVLGVHFMDDARLDQVAALRPFRIVVFTGSSGLHDVDATYPLEPWGDDELIEYLLAAHPAACGDVMRRVLAAEDRGDLEGIPEQWALVLDRMAADPGINGVGPALRSAIEPFLENNRIRELAQMHSWIRKLSFAPMKSSAGYAVSSLAWEQDQCREEMVALGAHRQLLRALKCPMVSLALVAEMLRDELLGDVTKEFFSRQMTHSVLLATAKLLAEEPVAISRLRQLADADGGRCQSMAVSLLHACGASWLPREGHRAKLQYAHVSGVQWARHWLVDADLIGADFSQADLSESRLSGARAKDVKLVGANLRRAALTGFAAPKEDLSCGNLSNVSANGANFFEAKLCLARCDKANFQGADLGNADLAGASFERTDLTGACLVDAKIAGADFRGANLQEANLSDLPMRKADWRGASFVAARMRGVDLEGVELPNANFEDAVLQDAALSGSRMPGANFLGANLCGTRLAHIHWEGANLRDADLRRSTFHMGTTRSGLLITPFASEGTRTGFYTDEYAEQHFKRPEDIRLANLRAADLRGAVIDDVDFYLVDLRDALFTDGQLQHFRRCRAILSD